ncbi:MAG: hypothetical protein RL607_206 [Bacteroidota bacterium]|jgi:hypothetical protein
MKRIALALFTLVALTACQQNQKAEATGDLPFFQFDVVEHYKVPYSKVALDSIIGKEDKTRMEQGLLQIVTGNIPVSTKDTLFVKNMEILGYQKTLLDPKIYPQIKHLFSKREPSKPIQPTCQSGYTDVLVFREKGKFVGSAKISFDCQRHQMIGERYNDADFGQSGEYVELKKLLE